MRKPKLLSRASLALLLALSAASALRAQQAPAPVARVSVVSVDALNKAAADFGIPMPMDIVKLTEGMPFFGPGALVTDKPVGVVILMSDTPMPPPAPQLFADTVVAVPVADGKSTKETLTAAHCEPVAGTADQFKLDTTFLRRVPNYLLIESGTAKGLAALPAAPFTQDYATPGNLALFTISLDAVRKAAPQGYKDFLNRVAASAGPANAAAKSSQDAVTGVLNGLDKMTVALALDEQSVHLKTWVAPVKIDGKPKDTPRPLFPKGTIAQLHYIYPNPEFAGWATSLIEKMPADAFDDVTPDKLPKFKTALQQVGKMLCGGNALSAAVSMKDGKPVVYLVSQLDQEMDPAKELKADAAVFNDSESKATHEVSSYDAGGKSVARWAITDKSDSSKSYVDVMSNGKVIYATISPSDGKYVQELADAGMNGSSSLMCAGNINLGAVAEMATPMLGALGMPPDAAEGLKKDLAGQAITWTVQNSDANFLYVDVALPKPLVKKALQFLPHTTTVDVTPAGTMPAGGKMNP